MTGLFDEVGNFRMCWNHASEIRFFRSSLLSCEGAMRVPSSLSQNQVMKKSTCVNLSERFLRGVIGKLLELSSDGEFFHVRFVPLTRGDFSLGSLVEIFEIKAASPCGFTSEDDSAFIWLSSRRSRNDRVCARCATTLRDRFCPCGDRENDRLKRFRLCS